MERRRNLRINEPLIVIVRRSSGGSKTHQLEAVTQDIGARGVRCFTRQIVEAGEKVFLHIRFARAGFNPFQTPVVSACAVILRAEEQAGGGCVFAACFSRRHFL